MQLTICELTYQEMADAVNAIPGWSGFSANDMKELMTAIAEARTRSGTIPQRAPRKESR